LIFIKKYVIIYIYKSEEMKEVDKL
jgi:hypothetical protein